MKHTGWIAARHAHALCERGLWGLPRVAAVAGLLLQAWPALAQGPGSPAAMPGLPQPVAQALAAAGVSPQAVSVLVAPLAPPAAPDAGMAGMAGMAGPRPGAGVRVAWRADAPMNPASVMKLVTTYAALDALGPGFTWKNRAYADGSLDAARGVLHGNLVLRGSGDPKLVLERIDEWFRRLVAKGVREVRGDILIDRSVFDLPPHDPAAFDDEPLRPYNAAPDGFLLNFKSIIYKFAPAPDGQRAIVQSEPPIAHVQIPSQLPLAAGACGNWRAALRADFGDPYRTRFEGRYPAACGEKSWGVAYVDPASYARRVVHAMWQAAGGTLTGQVREARTPAAARLLDSYESLPLAELVADVNKFSNNVMTQQVFLSLPLYDRSAAAESAGSFAASRAWLTRWWAAHWPRLAAPVIENGSGLSRRERITAQALAQVLQHAAASRNGQPFIQSLSVAGVDGTAARMAQRGIAQEALGNAQIKTGTLDDVSALAGYASSRSGQRYVVVAIANHPRAAAARPAWEQLLEWVARDL